MVVTDDGSPAKDKIPSKSRTSAKVDPTVQGQIGEKLREMYAQIVSEPVPDRFRDLLNDLKARDGGRDE